MAEERPLLRFTLRAVPSVRDACEVLHPLRGQAFAQDSLIDRVNAGREALPAEPSVGAKKLCESPARRPLDQRACLDCDLADEEPVGRVALRAAAVIHPESSRHPAICLFARTNDHPSS